MFYNTFKDLCDARGISCKKAAIEIGLSNSLPTAWKKRGLTPKADTLSKIADYFHVSTDFLLTDASENSFIRKIQFHLKSRGISEKTFCQDMGLSCSNLADFDAAGLTADQMRKFYNYLGLELNELKLGFTSLNKKQNPPAIFGEGKSEDAILFSAYKAAPENIQEAIRNLLGLK